MATATGLCSSSTSPCALGFAPGVAPPLLRYAAHPRPWKCRTLMSLKSVGRHNFDPSVYLVTDRRVTPGWTVEDIVRAAIQKDQGQNKGVTFVQLRDKHQEWKDSVRLGRELRQLTLDAGIAFVVNDNIELAYEVGADGVHVGQEDRNVKEARMMLGPDAIIGVSAGTGEEAEQAIADGADYLGVGCVFGTASKPDAGAPIGARGLQAAVRAARGRVPVVAIGGVQCNNVHECWRVGADGVAVVSAIMQSDGPGDVARFLNASKTSC